MVRLQLQSREDWTVPIWHSGVGQLVPIPCYHLYLQLCAVVPGDERGWRPSRHPLARRVFDAIVDTGSSLTNLPHDVWTAFESEIRWLDRADADPIVVGGTSHLFRLGRVLLAATDWQGRWMPPAWTLARCLAETDEPIPALLGLMSPFLMSGRRIQHRPDEGDRPVWWLEGP